VYTQTIEITNISTEAVTLNALPSVPNWTLVPGSGWTTPMAENETRTFTLRPNNFLVMGIYDTMITITGSGGAMAQVWATHDVTEIHPIDTFVVRLFHNVLRRNIDGTGYVEWTSHLREGVSGIQVAYGFFFSSEFILSNISNEEYVTILYRTFLGRTPGSSENAAWATHLHAGLPREDVFAGIANSVEFENLCTQAGIDRGTHIPPAGGMVRVFATRLYRTILQREPDAAGLNEWTHVLVSGQTTGSYVAHSFVFSQEMFSRNLNDGQYVDVLYNALLGRPADPGGRAAWVAALQQGASRDTVFWGFANSVEFELICQAHGIPR